MFSKTIKRGQFCFGDTNKSFLARVNNRCKQVILKINYQSDIIKPIRLAIKTGANNWVISIDTKLKIDEIGMVIEN